MHLPCTKIARAKICSGWEEYGREKGTEKKKRCREGIKEKGKERRLKKVENKDCQQKTWGRKRR